MATKNFKGFQLVSSAWFSQNAKDKDTLYFVRTNEAKSDGFLYFNNKKYGTAEDVKKALTKKYGELGGKTISDYVAAAVSDAKTELIGNDATAGTIKHAEKLATDASKKVDTEIGKLDVAGNISEAVKGVTVTVDETDGKVIKPVVSIADGTLTGAGTDGNLVTGTVVKKYVDDKVSDINTSANALSGRVDTLEGNVGSKAVEGGAAATGLFKDVADNKAAIAAETTRATAAETALSGRVTTLENTKHVDSLGGKTGAITVDGVGGEGAYKVKLAMTDQKLGATITGLGTAAGQNADAFDPAGAADGVKTALIGGATDDYNTLGKLETKIKAAQSAADKVSGVKYGDKVLALEGTELTSTISLSVDTSADGEGKKYIRLKGIGGADLGKIDTADFVKDGMLDGSALYTATAATGTVTINTHEYDLTGLTANHAYIVLVWNTDANKAAMAIDVTSLIDTYTAKVDGGLVLDNHAFSVDTTKIATNASVEKLNKTHAKVGEDFKTVATEVSEGIAGIAETSKASAEGEADVKVTVTTKSGSVSAVAVDSSRLAQKVTNNTNAIDKLNGDDTVPGSVNKKIKDALEAGAVTLEVKDTDAYLGVTSTTGANGTVYTLASKADEINKAIKAEADKVKVSVASAEGAYVTASVDAAGRAITLSEKVQSVEGSSTSAKGLAEASDVKNYVDGKVSSKNVAAEGESGDTALVSARASGNTVIVAATQKLTNAVAKAETSVQSVNGKASSAVTLTGADIATNQEVSGSTNATVNAVLADIYAKLRVAVKADGKTIK